MKKAQIFSTDMLFSFVIVLLCMGLFIAIMTAHVDITSESVKSAKMHQISMDAAALLYYRGSFEGLDVSAVHAGYEIGKENAPTNRKTCVYNTRGTGTNPIIVYVCDAS